MCKKLELCSNIFLCGEELAYFFVDGNNPLLKICMVLYPSLICESSVQMFLIPSQVQLSYGYSSKFNILSANLGNDSSNTDSIIITTIFKYRNKRLRLQPYLWQPLFH